MTDDPEVEAPDPQPAGLAALLARAKERLEESRREAEASKTAHSSMSSPEDRAEALALLARLDALRNWTPVASVALVHVQDCTQCGAVHEWFVGWFQEQQHRRLTGARRLVAGAAPSGLPQRVERQFQGRWATCPRCLRALEASAIKQLTFTFGDD